MSLFGYAQCVMHVRLDVPGVRMADIMSVARKIAKKKIRSPGLINRWSVKNISKK